jgi:hypothetical protein
MKNNVNSKTTGKEPQLTNSEITGKPTYLIADMDFIFRLFSRFPDGLPNNGFPRLLLPDLMAGKITGTLENRLNNWFESGLLERIVSAEEMLHEAFQTPCKPGLHRLEYLALLEARHWKLPAIACSPVISRMAGLLPVAITEGNHFLAQYAGHSQQHIKGQRTTTYFFTGCRRPTPELIKK